MLTTSKDFIPENKPDVGLIGERFFKIICRIFKCWFAVGCLASNILSITTVCTLFMALPLAIRQPDISDYGRICSLFIVALCFDFIISNKKKIKRLFEMMDSLYKTFEQDGRKNIKKTCLINFFLIILLFIFKLSLGLIIYQDPAVIERWKTVWLMSFFGYSASHSWLYTMFLCFFTELLCGTLTVLTVTFTSLCRILKAVTNQFNNNIIDLMAPDNIRSFSDNLLFLQKRYVEMQAFFQLFNDVFDKIVFVWLGISLVTSCVMIKVLFLMPMKFETILLIVNGIIFAVAFVSYSTISLSDSSDGTLPLLQKASLERRQTLTTDDRLELGLFFHNISSNPLKVTAGKCFVLDRKFFMSFAGVVVSFLIISIQMDLQAMNAVQG